MSISSIRNQPILFDYTGDECACVESNYKQLVDNNDQVYLQLKTTPCGEALNVNFFKITTWGIKGGSLNIEATGTSGLYSFRVYPTAETNLLYVVVEISQYTSGTLTFAASGSQSYDFTSAGSFGVWFNFAVFNETVSFVFTSSDFVGTFNSVPAVLESFNNPILTVIDSSNDIVATGAAYENYSEEYITFGVDFSDLDLPIGCYRFGLSDPCLNTCGQFRIDNGLFTNEQNWTLVNNATIDTVFPNNGLALENDAGNASAVSATTFCINKQYFVEFEVDLIVGAPQVRVSIGNSSTIIAFAAGSFSGTITSTVGTALTIENVGAALSRAFIKNVRVRFADAEPAEVDYYSNTLSLGDYINECDTSKLEGCNADDAFGFKFSGTGFLPGIRLKKRFFRAAYDIDAEIQRGLSGTWNAPYVDRIKSKELALDAQPEYVFDFLSILIFFDTFYVNQQTYFPKEDTFPSIQWSNEWDLGLISIALIEKTDLVRKVQCTNSEAFCLPSTIDLPEDSFVFQDGEGFLFQDGIQYDFQD